MPKYIYRCKETGEEQELELNITLRPEELGNGWTEVVDGEPRTWKRVFTPPGIIFRGSGWAGKS